ncbi:MAG: M15 family metallopeptidase [Acutalibacter sp.]|jgi:D-alanyl-D-alanine carboxypeptidase
MRHHKPRHTRKPGIFKQLTPWLGAALCLVLVIALWPRISLNAASQTTTGQAAEDSQDTSSGPSATPSLTVQEDPPWYLRLVNRDHPLPQDFTVEVVSVQDGQFDSRAAEDLKQMLADMEAQGLSPLICSSFRTWEDQETLHQEEVANYQNQGLSQEEAEKEASRWVVPAGQSEHQLGLAADIVAQGFQILEEEQESTPEQQWLMTHCWEYGFILRYPKDKEALTGVGYEPWHYRYVGQEAAREITEQKLCLEEYVEQLERGGQLASSFCG